jgi:NAD(P)-dependent dehydrogenase (short-subunit alcohol dehydrogenase family)
MELGLKGKVALITGAGSPVGFGKGTALVLAREGCNIVAADIDLEGAKQTAAEVEALGRKALAFQTDVTDKKSVDKMVKAAVAKLGRVDILVNNAGSAGPRKPFVDKPESEWDWDMNLNFKGVLYCTQAVLPQMLAGKSGKIINISSGAAKTGGPMVSIYCSAKSAVIGFTKSLAKEVITSGINVNCIAPGVGDTNFYRNSKPGAVAKFVEQTPSGRPVTPEEIGNMVAFLASNVSSNVVGQTISVDGGLTMTC